MPGLLLFFEFLNLFMNPYIAKVTLYTPLFTLLVMVLIASLLIPLHHRIELWIKEKLVVKNKKIRLAAAKRTVRQLEKVEESLTDNFHCIVPGKAEIVFLSGPSFKPVCFNTGLLGQGVIASLQISNVVG